MGFTANSGEECGVVTLMSAANKSIEAGHIWTFPGGIHPPERKDRSNTTPIAVMPLPSTFHVPIKQHSGPVGELLVQVGDHVKAGQPLTQSGINNGLPVHA